MRLLVVAALVAVTLAGCSDDNDVTARLIIDFNDQNRGVNDIDTEVTFDPADRPSAAAYEGRDVAHPDAYTVHDLIIDWNNGHAIGFQYFDGLGYSLDSVFAVASQSEGGCWFWQLAKNNAATNAGISATTVAAGDEIRLTYTSCWEQPAEADLTFDFNGQREGPQLIETTLAYDAATRPSNESYEGRDVQHPDGFTVHDLLVTWPGHADGALNLTYFDGLGYGLQGVLGVEAVFGEDSCWFWRLSIDGRASQVGMSEAVIEDGADVVWQYTDCSQ